MFFQPYNSIKNKITRKFHYVYFNVSDDATRGEILINIDKKKKYWSINIMKLLVILFLIKVTLICDFFEPGVIWLIALLFST